jgi:hypothetical protein
MIFKSLTSRFHQSLQQGLLAAHRRLLREGEVATAAVGGGKLQLLIFNDILVPFPKVTRHPRSILHYRVN